MDMVIQHLVSNACANNGALLLHIIASVGGTVGLASVAANFRSKLPAPVVSVIDVLALNFVKSLSQTAEEEPAKTEPSAAPQP